MPHRMPPLLLAWVGFMALAVAMGIGRFAFTPMLPMMQEDLGLGLSQGGWLASANYLGYFAGAMTAGMLPWRGRTLLITGLVLVTITTALMGVTTNWSMWIAWRSIAGVASAWVFVGTASLCIARLTRAAAPPRLTGLVFAGVGVGIALAGMACMALDLRGYDAGSAWWALGAFAAAGTLATWPLWRITADPLHPPPAPLPRGSDEGAWRLIIIYGLFGFGYILPATFLPAQARALLQDVALFGWAWPVFGLAAAASTLLCSGVLMRLPPRLLWAIAQLIMALGVALPALMPGLTSIVIAALCVGGTFMVITMLGMQQAQLTAGPRARGLMANLTAAFAAGQLAGPVFFSLLNEHFDGTLATALYTAAALLALGTLLLLKPFPAHQEVEPAGTDQTAGIPSSS